MVAKKANIAEPIAQVAVDTVFSFLKDKLPPVVGNTLESLLGSGSVTTTPAKKSTKTAGKKTTATAKKNDNPLGGLGNIVGSLGSLFGGK